MQQQCNYTSEIVIDISPAIGEKVQHNSLEQEIRQLRHKLTSLVENNPLAVIEWDKNFQITEWNYTAQKIFGYSKQQALGQNLLELVISENNRESTQAVFQQPLQGLGSSIEAIRENLTQDGKLISCQWHNTPLIDADGTIMGVVSLVQEMAIPQSSTTFLQKQNDLADLILYSMSDGVIVADEQGKFLVFNPAAEQMFGEGLRDIYQQEWLENYSWFMPDQKTPFPTSEFPLLQAIQGKTCKNVEIFFSHCQTLEGRWIMVNGRPIKDATGKLIGGLIVCAEITERKQIEATLQEQQAQYRSIFEAVNDAIFIDDLETGRLVEVNPATTRMLGYSLEELKQLSPPDYVHADSLHLFQNYIETLRNEGYFYCQAVDICKDGRHINVEVTGTCCTYNGKPHGLALVRDITERTKAELALQQSEAQLRQQAQEIEQALKELQSTQSQLIQSEKMSSLGQLVAGVAHEINNPVNFIYGNLKHAQGYIDDLLDLFYLYQEKYPDISPEIQERSEEIDLDFLLEDLPKLLSSIKMGAERIRQIVASLRVFSRMDEAEFKAVDIHEGIESTLMILQNRLKAKPDHPEIKVIKEYGKLPFIECYAGQLNQVFMNMLSNAIDAIEEKDAKRSFQEIEQSPGIIKINTKISEKGQLIIRIADNGIGISPEVKTQLFDPFFTTKPVGKGTGLGLAISYEIITKKHHGSLECLSTRGEGTEFIVTIPIQQVHQKVKSN